MTEANAEQDVTRETLANQVTVTKQAYDAARAALKNFDEARRSGGGTEEKRRGRRATGVPTIEDALATIIRGENQNQPMTAAQVYQALVKHTEWTYKSNNLESYVRYTLSGRKDIFDRPHVTVNGKVEKRGWYSVREDYQSKDGSAPKITLSRPKGPTQTNADAILNTELTLGTQNNPFKPAEETA